MEDNLYNAGHFQSLVTLQGQDAIFDYLKTGNLNELSEIPEASDIFYNFPDLPVPLEHIRKRIFTNALNQAPKRGGGRHHVLLQKVQV